MMKIDWKRMEKLEKQFAAPSMDAFCKLYFSLSVLSVSSKDHQSDENSVPIVLYNYYDMNAVFCI